MKSPRVDQYIDIHTHSSQSESDVYAIQSLSIQEAQRTDLDKSIFSVGIHPWDSESVDESTMTFLKKISGHPNFFALGELGLDKKSNADFSHQLTVFQKQLQLAVELNVPRIIIHCVRAYAQVYQEIRKAKYKGVILFHDFNGTIEMAQEILLHTNSYFSFGHKIFDARTKAYTAIAKIELEKIFIESDCNKKYTIEQLYEQAAKILILSKTDLLAVISANYRNFSKCDDKLRL